MLLKLDMSYALVFQCGSLTSSAMSSSIPAESAAASARLALAREWEQLQRPYSKLQPSEAMRASEFYVKWTQLQEEHKKRKDMIREERAGSEKNTSASQRKSQQL